MDTTNSSSEQKTSVKDCFVAKKDCCNDVVKFVEGQDNLKLDFTNLDFQQQVFITSFVYSYFNLFESTPTQAIPFKDYSPPNLVVDIHVLDQVFLI